MKKLKILTGHSMLVMISALAVLVSGCKKEEKEIVPLPEIRFQTPTLDVDSEGGDYSVGYTVTNPVSDGVLELTKDADWIKNLSYTETVISFSVDANPSFDEERRGNVAINYQGSSDTLVLVQPAADAGNGNLKIDITVSAVTSVSISASFEPSEQDSTYCVACVAKADFEAFATDVEFIEAQVDGLEREAALAGLSIEEYLEDYVLKSGSLTRDFAGLVPETGYYIIAFELSVHGVPGPRLFKAEATTEEDSGSGDVDVTFDLSAEVDGSTATLRVEPSDETVRYYQSYISVDYLNYLGTDLKGSIEYTIEQEIYYGTDAGQSVSEIIDRLSSYGPVEYTAELYSTSENYLFAVAIDEFGNLVSDVSSITFAMEKPASDNEITLAPGEVGVDKAEVNVTTTNDDPYMIGIAKSTSWAGYSDEEIAEALLSQGYGPYNGTKSFTFNSLSAGTDYVVAVVGYDAGTFTTDVAKCYFTTQSLGNLEDMEFEFTIENITPFGAKISVSATPETNLYFWYYAEAWMEEEDVKAGIDMIIQDFLANGMISSRIQYFQITGSRGYDSSVITSMKSDTEYRVYAIGIDESNGNYGTPMFFSEPFRTSAREEVDIVVEACIESYYDCEELVDAGYSDYAGYLGYAIANLSAKVSGSDDCSNYYFHMLTADYTDKSVYSDDELLEILFSYGFDKTTPTVQVAAPFDKICTLIAVGLDESGNPGDVFRKAVTFTKDGAWDVDTFVPVSTGTGLAVPAGDNVDYKGHISSAPALAEIL